MTPPARLLAALYPFAAGAMAVNLFFASLIGSWLGWPVLTPWQSVAGGLVIGLPATWAFAGHIGRLIARAEAGAAADTAADPAGDDPAAALQDRAKV